jgi:hypothetical protein
MGTIVQMKAREIDAFLLALAEAVEAFVADRGSVESNRKTIESMARSIENPESRERFLRHLESTRHQQLVFE